MKGLVENTKKNKKNCTDVEREIYSYYIDKQ